LWALLKGLLTSEILSKRIGKKAPVLRDFLFLCRFSFFFRRRRRNSPLSEKMGYKPCLAIEVFKAKTGRGKMHLQVGDYLCRALAAKKIN